MPRKREVKKREILPDPKYHDLLTAKFINGIMRRGKKSTARRNFLWCPRHHQRENPLRPAKDF